MKTKSNLVAILIASFFLNQGCSSFPSKKIDFYGFFDRLNSTLASTSNGHNWTSRRTLEGAEGVIIYGLKCRDNLLLTLKDKRSGCEISCEPPFANSEKITLYDGILSVDGEDVTKIYCGIKN